MTQKNRIVPMRRASRGQSAVEFAFLAVVGLMVLLVSIQFAMIGQAALAVSQGAYIGARWASVNSAASSSDVNTYVHTNGSPTLNSNMMVATATANTGGDPTNCPTMTTRLFGCQVTVTVTFNDINLIALPNPFLGITFPTALTAQQNSMTE